MPFRHKASSEFHALNTPCMPIIKMLIVLRIEVMWAKICIGLASVATAGGVFFLGVAARYALIYFMEPENASRHEYLQGVALSIMMAVPFWLFASGTLWPLRAKIPKLVFVSVNAVTVALFVIFLAANLYPLLMVALEQ